MSEQDAEADRDEDDDRAETGQQRAAVHETGAACASDSVQPSHEGTCSSITPTRACRSHSSGSVPSRVRGGERHLAGVRGRERTLSSAPRADRGELAADLAAVTRARRVALAASRRSVKSPPVATSLGARHAAARPTSSSAPAATSTPSRISRRLADDESDVGQDRFQRSRGSRSFSPRRSCA